MTSSFGGNSNVNPLRQWQCASPAPPSAKPAPAWHYGPGFDPARLGDNHQQLVDILEGAGAEIDWLDDALVSSGGLADAVFTYDPSFVTDAGAILMNMGKTLRRPETLAHRALYESLDIPVIGTIEAPGSVEGGDCFWLDATTLAVGRGFRTNQIGIDQLTDILAPTGVRVVAYDLPYGDGPDACLHLLSLVSPLSAELALIYAPLLPTALYQELRLRG
ncbi:MAG: arginine deiminase family protein [Acidimicrobiales bacterium]